MLVHQAQELRPLKGFYQFSSVVDLSNLKINETQNCTPQTKILEKIYIFFFTASFLFEVTGRVVEPIPTAYGHMNELSEAWLI